MKRLTRWGGPEALAFFAAVSFASATFCGSVGCSGVSKSCKSSAVIHRFNWLRVLDPAELTQIDQRVCQQLHPIMPLLDTFKSEQQAFEFIFPREAALNAHPQRMDGFVEEAFPSALRGLAVAGILFDIGDQAGIENALPIMRGIKAAIKVEVGTSEVQPDLLGHLLQGLQALG